MIKTANINWYTNKLLNILNNVHPEALIKSDGTTYIIFGDHIYADSDGVYNTIVVNKAGMPIAGGYVSIKNMIEHILWQLNVLYRPLKY